MTDEICHESIPITRLFAHGKNYRQHPASQIKQLKASLERFQQVRSIVVADDGNEHYTILAGHGIVDAAMECGIVSLRCDVVPASWSEDDRRAYLIADNMHAQNAVDDEAILAALLEEQQNSGYDLAALGTDDEALRQMIEALGDDYLGNGEQQEGAGGDEFDTTPEEGPTRTNVGEIWQLGEHRLLVGDCTKPENLVKLMDSKKIDLLWTDPPYNIDVAGGSHDPRSPDYRSGKQIQNDDVSTVEFYRFLCSAFKALDAFMNDGAVYYIAHPDIFAYEFVGAIRAVPWKQARPPVVLWVKDSMVFGRGDYHARSEPILYGWKPGAGHHQVADRTQDNVWEIPRPKRSEDHPTMKPLELVERAINNSSDAKDIVFDGFLGSGTTLIASHRTGRRCYGCELDPKYADVILRRYESEMDQQATLLDCIAEVTHA